ncbi:MAG: hypothetical protein AAGD11_03385 [Planctomycetota bacterium]
MASPFYLFRKYQRAFIAIAAVIAMFIFVVADPLMSWLQSSGGGPQRSGNTIVATWDGGEINLMELERLTQRRYKISEFLRNLIGRAARTIEQEGGTALPPNLPDFILPNTNPQMVQQGCVTTRVFSQLAMESGISVSDAFVNHYLKEWGLGQAGDTEIANLLSQIRLSDKALFAGLRELLLTHFYTSGYSLATAGVTPEQRWQDWKKINERIIVEAAELPVDSFLAEVPDPSDADLTKLYDQHKDRVGEFYDLVDGVPLRSPDPGFRIPRQVKIQYLTANVEDWSQKLLETVTDEEIADYYERNKRTQFVKSSASTSAAEPAQSTSIEGLFDDEPAASDKDAESAEDTQTESPEDMAEPSETPADGEAGGTEATSETSTDLAPTEEPAADEAKIDSTDEGPLPDSPASEDTGASNRPSPFRLVAIQNEATSTSDDEAGDDKAGGAEGEAGSEEATAEADEQADSADDAEEEVEFEPLENVADQIRRSLAVDKAVVELQEICDRTMAALEEEYTPYGYSVVEARSSGSEAPTPPAKLADYKALATETGLISEETVLLSQQQLADTQVGRTVDSKSRTKLVHQAMFGDIQLYEPFRAVDLAGNTYIVCKTEDVPSRVPDFEDVRDDVAAAWKKAEAAKLALAKAQALSKAATDSGDRITIVAGAENFDVVTTDAFSWLSFGATQADMRRGPRLAQAPPLESVDEDFMTKAFDLKPDEKIAVMNHDQTYAYVIQLSRREQTKDELKQRFLSDSVNGWFGGQVMTTARFQNAQRQLYSNLTEAIDLNLDGLEKILADSQQ